MSAKRIVAGIVGGVIFLGVIGNILMIITGDAPVFIGLFMLSGIVGVVLGILAMWHHKRRKKERLTPKSVWTGGLIGALVLMFVLELIGGGDLARGLGTGIGFGLIYGGAAALLFYAFLEPAGRPAMAAAETASEVQGTEPSDLPAEEA